MTGIAGTYFTSWEYDITTQSFQLGPIVVIGTDNSVVVDGVTIVGAMVFGTAVSWTSAAGNPSSAMVAFELSTSLNAMTFGGIYWMSGDDQPSAANFFGFNTQPQAPLNRWASTYYCYELAGGNNEPLGNLVISGTTAIFAGQTINNPIYTGLTTSADGTSTDTNELAWFTTDGNENNAAISFFSQDGFNFNGNIWAAGANRPVGSASTANNFFGTTQSAADADAVNVEAEAAHAVEEVAAAGALLAAMVLAAAAKIAELGVGGNDYFAVEALEAQARADNVENAAPAADEENDAGGDDDGGDDAGAGDDAAEAGGDDVLDDIVDAVADVLEVVADLLVVTPDTTPPNTKGRKSKNASGLSAKQLLDLKNGS
jgi:hypothetical protein